MVVDPSVTHSDETTYKICICSNAPKIAEKVSFLKPKSSPKISLTLPNEISRASTKSHDLSNHIPYTRTLQRSIALNIRISWGIYIKIHLWSSHFLSKNKTTNLIAPSLIERQNLLNNLLYGRKQQFVYLSVTLANMRDLWNVSESQN